MLLQCRARKRSEAKTGVVGVGLSNIALGSLIVVAKAPQRQIVSGAEVFS
jgi:hypothetical protein